MHVWSLDHARKVFHGFCDCAKFGCNRRSNFDSIQVLIFCTLSLKMPIHDPKMRAFGEFNRDNGEQYERDPQKALSCKETHCITYRSSKSDQCCGSLRAEE